MVQKIKTFGQKEVFEELRAAAAPRQPVQQVNVLENRKKSPRVRQFKNVQIIFNNGYSTYNGILRDLSEDGVRIEVKHILEIPNVFTLKFNHDNSTKQCSLIWRDKNFIGASFFLTKT